MDFHNATTGYDLNNTLGFFPNSTEDYNLTAIGDYALYNAATYAPDNTTISRVTKTVVVAPISVWVQLQYVVVPSVFLGICFVLGILGNSLVIYTILFQIGQRSFTVVLLLNMAVADFIVLITLPMWIHSLCDQWIYGLLLCQFLTYVIYVSMYASVFFITLVSIHRFLAVLFPFLLLRFQKRIIIYAFILAMWVLSLIFAAPVFIYRTTVEKNYTVHCSGRVYSSKEQKEAILTLETLVGFGIPFFVLCVCYGSIIRRIQHLKSRTKIRSEKLIASVVVSFFVCWFPYHIFNLMAISALVMEDSNPDASAALDRAVKAANNIPGTFAFISSCLNPILYAFAAQSFRGGLKETNFAKLFGQLTDDTLGKISSKLCHISGGSQIPFP